MIALYKLLDLLGFHFFSSREFRNISGAAAKNPSPLTIPGPRGDPLLSPPCIAGQCHGQILTAVLRGQCKLFPSIAVHSIDFNRVWMMYSSFSRCFWMISSIHFYAFLFYLFIFSIFFQSFLMFSHWSAVGSAPPRPRKWLSGLRPWITSSPMPEALVSLIVLVA